MGWRAATAPPPGHAELQVKRQSWLPDMPGTQAGDFALPLCCFCNQQPWQGSSYTVHAAFAQQLAEGLSCLERHGCMQARASSDTGAAWLAASDHVCPVQHIARFLFFLFNGTSAGHRYVAPQRKPGCSGAAHAPPLVFHVRLQTCSCWAAAWACSWLPTASSRSIRHGPRSLAGSTILAQEQPHSI